MSSLHSKSLIATAAIFCCRFTGLLREVVYTGLFGATGALDAFLTAFRVPNMLRDMFAEGAMSQSFTSVMSKMEASEGPEAAWQLANRVMSQLISLMVCIVSLGILLAGVFMQLLYPERAAMEVTCPAAIVQTESPIVTATYQGMAEDADGRAQAKFVLSERPVWLTDTSCLRVKKLEQLTVGEQVTLCGERSAADGKAILVEKQNFLGLAADLCRIMWPFILLASLSALCMGALNVFGVFGLPNLASAAFNLTTVAFGALFGWLIDPSFGPNALYGFAAAVVLGGMAQVLVQVPKMRSKGFRPRWDLALSWQTGKLMMTDANVRRVWMLMVPGVIAAGITQVTVFFNTTFGLYLPGGAVTALSSAFHLWQLPVALFGVAVGMVVLPTVSRLTLSGDDDEGKSEIARHLAIAMRFVAFFAIPSMAFLGIWGEEIVSVFFQRGRFDSAASELTGQVLTAYSLGLLGYAGMKVLQPVFLALEKPWAPAWLALGACCVSLSLNYTFVHVLGLGANWLALTTAFVTTLNFFFYFFYLRHLLKGMACNLLIPGLLRTMGAGVVLGLLCWQTKDLLFDGFTQWSFMARFMALAAGGIILSGCYLAAAFCFRVPELDMLAARFMRRRG